MQKRRLGRTGLNVSELCLGTMLFGWKTNEEVSFAMLDAFRQAGGNFVQAVGVCPDFPMVSAWAELPELHLGRWMRARGVNRDDWVLSTRLNLCRPSVTGGSMEKTIRWAVEASMRRLNTHYLDLLLIEWSDAVIPVEDVLAAVTTLVRAGMLRYCGVSSFPVWRVADAIGKASARNTARPEAFQTDYSLLRRNVSSLDALDLCREHRVGFLARSPLARGLLVDTPLAATQLQTDAHGGTSLVQGVQFELGNIARMRDLTSSQVALAWVWANPHVAASIVGVRTLRHLEEALAAAQLRLSSEELMRLDAVSLHASPSTARGGALTHVESCSAVSLGENSCRKRMLITA